jgi:integrase/recombinase XerD
VEITPVGISLATALRDFLADCRLRNLSSRTLECYRDIVGDLLASAPPRADLTYLDLAVARLWLLSKEDHAPASRSLYVRVIRRFARWCAAEYEGYHYRLERLSQPSVPATIPKALSQARLLGLIDCNDDPVLYTLTFLVETGLRASEAIEVRLSDLDHEGVLVRAPKGDRERIVPISAHLAKETRAYLAKARGAFIDDPECDVLLISARGKPHSRRTLHRTVADAGLRAGIEGLGPHDLRRQFAHDLGEAGVSLHVLALLLGHRSLDMVARYARAVDADSVRALARTSPLGAARGRIR